MRCGGFGLACFKRVGDVRFGFVGYEVWHLGFAEKVG